MKRSTFLRNSLAVLTPTVISGNPIHVLNNHSMVEPEVLANVNNDRVLVIIQLNGGNDGCLLYTSPSPRDVEESRMPSSA